MMEYRVNRFQKSVKLSIESKPRIGGPGRRKDGVRIPVGRLDAGGGCDSNILKYRIGNQIC